MKPYEIAIVGGGIVGLATAHALTRDGNRRVVVLEAETEVARHQTGNNSGVIHSGLYYRPGSLKASNCTRGRDAIYRFCDIHEIPHERCGKLVVALSEEERPRLDELERRGQANGLEGLRRVTGDQLLEYEPNVAGIDGLWVPTTGIIDYIAAAKAMARAMQERGGELRTGARVTGVARRDDGFVIESENGESVHARRLINCAGLQCDRIARMCGSSTSVRIIPFRGEYYKLTPEAEHLVKNLIYPVPDPRFPFLGVHFTRMILGGVEAGPNAVLAFKREGYRWRDLSLADTADALSYSGFWRMAGRYWQTGMGEVHRSLSKAAFVRALQRLVPALRPDQLTRHGAGVRAQAVGPDGKLHDDFVIESAPHMLHVLNAPSPGATASLSIGQTLARMALDS
ncbi:MAG: L-2-hydroxyglutarate oxidase [Acidobacteriota bacterium]|nr:L-2-hydroxyglutarate oxidase [Acidobacteriota bacterium]MDH3785256.1 L-2-hydroxyglutarate oxidase [Acidobacteriota bacterium]